MNIWDADRHGYIPRVQAVIQEPSAIRRVAPCSRTGSSNVDPAARTAMPHVKRAGTFVTLRDSGAGSGEATRPTVHISHAPIDNYLDFDLDVAKEQSRENPHCTTSNTPRQAREPVPRTESRNIKVPAERSGCYAPRAPKKSRRTSSRPWQNIEMIEEAALAYEPHRITYYLQRRPGLLHNYYFKHRVITEDAARTKHKALSDEAGEDRDPRGR